MHPLISKLLKKRGIESIDELNEDIEANELAQFRVWQEALTASEVTVESITKFCEKQKDLIEAQYTNPNNSDKQDRNLKSSLAIYKAILAFISGSKVARERAIKEIEYYLKK